MKRRQFIASVAVGSLASALATQQSLAGADELARAEDFDPSELGIAALQRQLGNGLTSAALITAYLARISRFDHSGPRYQSVLAINPDALTIARTLDDERRAGKPRGPLHGIPLLIKDNIATSDRMPTTAGSLALEKAFHRVDAALVAKLRSAGAIILGKTNLSEWANFRSTYSSSGWSAVGGQTGNAYDPARNPSGSSSGSATAAALSFCAAAIGTETDGSILSPSAVNGLVGFKPSIGAVSGVGIVPLSPRQDVAGPMARSVEDARLLASVMYETSRHSANIGDVGSRKVRVGMVPASESMRAEVVGLYRSAAEIWRASGADIVDAPLPKGLQEAGEAEFTALLFEFRDALDRYLKNLSPAQTTARSLAELIQFNRQHADRELREFGQEIFELAIDKGPLSEPAYLDSVRTLRRLVEVEGLELMFRDLSVDVLVAPGSGPAGFIDPILGDRPDLGGSSLGSAAAVAGYPSLTLPMGLVRGMPVGMTVVARRHDEDRLLDIAERFERTGRLRVPPRPSSITRHI